MKVEFWHQFQELLKSQQQFVLVTLVDIKGSVPQVSGAKILVGHEGLLAGTIGGGSIEAHAIKEATAMLDHKEPSKLATYNLATLGMTCGGSAQLFFETFNLNTWHIAIFGAGHVAQALVPVLLKLSATITCIDTREGWLNRLPNNFALNKLRVSSMNDAITLLSPASFVLIMTRGHEFDLEVLEAALTRADFPYVGLMGSKTKAASFRSTLKDKGFSDEAINSFYCPVGLPIGNSEPEEISISIAAQLLQQRDRMQSKE